MQPSITGYAPANMNWLYSVGGENEQVRVGRQQDGFSEKLYP